MKICTVNIPESYIDAIEKLIGEDGLYPSRSELVRCAVRAFLIRELTMAKKMAKYNAPNSEEIIEDFDIKNFVRIPVEPKDKDEPVRTFKTYKILRRLENSEDDSESGDLIKPEINYDLDNDFDDDEKDIFFKSDKEEYVKPSLEQRRQKYPNRPEYKFINEGEKGSLLNI